MREVTYRKLNIRFTEKQIKELLNFFNPKHAKLDEHIAEFYIHKKSPLCIFFSSHGNVDCNECTIGKVLDEHGCNDLLAEAGGPSIRQLLYIDDEGVEWAESDDKQARALLERIRKYIRELPRI